MSSVERLVVIAPNWLGDAVMALPAIADVRRHFSNAHVTVAARGSLASLFAMVPGVDDVLALPGRGGVRALSTWKDDAAALAQGRYDTALLLPNSFLTALVTSRASIAERWGYAADLRQSLLTRAIARPKAGLHQGAYYQALTTALGAAPGPMYATVRSDLERARELLREIGLDPDEPFVVLAPGAAYGKAKQWLPERFAELADLVANRRGWTVVMVGSAADRSACGDIAARFPSSGSRLNRLVDLSGKTDLPMLAGVMRAARAVVSNDSGAMHLAGAVGTKVVAVFGATNEQRTAPLPAGPDSPPPAIVSCDVFCRPCMLRECPIDHRCMRGITAGRVFEELTGTGTQA